jgi:hypothetical protein
MTVHSTLTRRVNSLLLDGCFDRVEGNRCVTEYGQLATARREREGLLDQRDAGSRSKKEAFAVDSAIDAELLFLNVFFAKLRAAHLGDCGANHTNGKLSLVAAGRSLLYLHERTMALQDRVAVETEHAIPVLISRSGAADQEQGVGERCGDARAASGDRCGDSVLRVVPQVFADAPMVVSSEGDANLAVVGQDRWRQRGALASSQDDVKVVVEELNINILFGLDMERIDEQIVHLLVIAFVHNSSGNAVARR